MLRDDDLDLSTSYHNLVRQTGQKNGLSNIFPDPIIVIPGLASLNTVKVTTLKFVEQLYSLISDEELMQPKT